MLPFDSIASFSDFTLLEIKTRLFDFSTWYHSTPPSASLSFFIFCSTFTFYFLHHVSPCRPLIHFGLPLPPPRPPSSSSLLLPCLGAWRYVCNAGTHDWRRAPETKRQKVSMNGVLKYTRTSPICRCNSKLKISTHTMYIMPKQKKKHERRRKKKKFERRAEPKQPRITHNRYAQHSSAVTFGKKLKYVTENKANCFEFSPSSSPPPSRYRSLSFDI